MIDSVKGLSKKDISDQLQAMREGVKREMAENAEKLKHADNQLLQLVQKFDKFEDDHKKEFSELRSKVRNMQKLEYQMCRQIQNSKELSCAADALLSDAPGAASKNPGAAGDQGDKSRDELQDQITALAKVTSAIVESCMI